MLMDSFHRFAADAKLFRSWKIRFEENTINFKVEHEFIVDLFICSANFALMFWFLLQQAHPFLMMQS